MLGIRPEDMEDAGLLPDAPAGQTLHVETDIREDILARLRDIAEDVDGVEYAARNVIDITETKLPAVAVLEGDEEPSPSTNPAKHRGLLPLGTFKRIDEQVEREFGRR